MTDRDYYNCVFPEKRPPNVWVIIDATTNKSTGYEIAANSETEARIKVSQHISTPFRLSHIEE